MQLKIGCYPPKSGTLFCDVSSQAIQLSVLRVSYEHMGLRVCEHHQVSIDLAISSVLSELEGISSLKDEKRADLEYLRSGAC